MFLLRAVSSVKKVLFKFIGPIESHYWPIESQTTGAMMVAKSMVGLFVAFAVVSVERCLGIHRIPIQRQKSTILLTDEYDYGDTGEQDGVEPFVIHKTADYLVGSIYLGTPLPKSVSPKPQLLSRRQKKRADNEYKVVLDTTKSNMWVFGTGLKLPQDKSGFQHNYYNVHSSLTYHHYNKPDKMFMTSGMGENGTYSGQMALDTLRFGDSEIEDAAFGIIYNFEGEDASAWELQTFDGVLGLGFSNAALNGATPPIVKMTEDNMFANNVVSFYISANGKDGEVMVGGYDEELFLPPLRFSPVIAPRGLKKGIYWEVKLAELRIGTFPLASGASVVVDTGIEGFRFPAAVVDRVIDKTGAFMSHKTGEVTIDCSQRQRLDNIHFVLEGSRHSFGGVEYFAQPEKGDCKLLIESSAGKMHDFSVGMAFLQKFYTVLDYGKGQPRIGFATAVRQSYDLPAV